MGHTHGRVRGVEGWVRSGYLPSFHPLALSGTLLCRQVIPMYGFKVQTHPVLRMCLLRCGCSLAAIAYKAALYNLKVLPTPLIIAFAEQAPCP
jgi:hypothetical protein